MKTTENYAENASSDRDQVPRTTSERRIPVGDGDDVGKREFREFRDTERRRRRSRRCE